MVTLAVWRGVGTVAATGAGTFRPKATVGFGPGEGTRDGAGFTVAVFTLAGLPTAAGWLAVGADPATFGAGF